MTELQLPVDILGGARRHWWWYATWPFARLRVTSDELIVSPSRKWLAAMGVPYAAIRFADLQRVEVIKGGIRVHYTDGRRAHHIDFWCGPRRSRALADLLSRKIDDVAE